MKLVRQGNQEYWKLSEDEIGQRRGQRSNKRIVMTNFESPAVVKECEWATNEGQGAELHSSICHDLRDNGFSVFSGKQIRLSPGPASRLNEIKAIFNGLQYPSFGGPGVPGFFGGRKLLSFEATLFPAEIALRSNNVGFLTALLAGVIRALPDYNKGKAYPLSWILSRHEYPVESMPFHQDRVGWLVQFNIDRTSGVRGGSIQLRNASDARIVESSSLKGFLDGYIVKDSLFEHGTTSMTMDRPGVDHRDVLVVRLPSDTP